MNTADIITSLTGTGSCGEDISEMRCFQRDLVGSMRGRVERPLGLQLCSSGQRVDCALQLSNTEQKLFLGRRLTSGRVAITMTAWRFGTQSPSFQRATWQGPSDQPNQASFQKGGNSNQAGRARMSRKVLKQDLASLRKAFSRGGLIKGTKLAHL
jgi:hypothetical protein